VEWGVGWGVARCCWIAFRWARFGEATAKRGVWFAEAFAAAMVACCRCCMWC